MSESQATAELLRDAAIDFLSHRPDRARLRGHAGCARGVDRQLWRESAELGWTGVLLPEALGGMGLSCAEALVLCEEAGRHLYAEPLVASALMPAIVLGAAAEGPAAEAVPGLAETLLSGERLLSLAWQLAPGQLLLGPAAARLEAGRLSGGAVFVAGCEPDGIALVWAESDGGPAVFAVDLQAKGVQLEALPVGLGSQAHLRMEAVEPLLTQPLLQGPAALQAVQHALCVGRLAAAVELTGGAAGCLAQTLAYLGSRQQFDRPIGSFQAVQHRCVDLYIELELAGASWRHAAALLEAGDPLSVEVEAAVYAAKARAGDVAVKVGRESVQLHGAMGFCEEVDIGLYLRVALAGQAWLGGGVLARRRFAELQAGSSAAKEWA